MIPKDIFTLKTTGEKLWAAVYEPAPEKFYGAAKFVVTADADSTEAPPGFEEFVRKGKYYARSNYRPRVNLIRRPVEDLVNVLQEYDARNIPRNHLFRICSAVHIDVSIYEYRYHAFNNVREGRALSLESISIEWPQ